MLKVLACSDQVDNLGLLHQECAPDVAVPAHRHDFAEILYVVSGQASVFVNDETRVLEGGEGVVIAAGSVHGFENCGPERLTIVGAFGAAELATELVEP